MLCGKSERFSSSFAVVMGKKKNVNMELHMLDMVIFSC